MKLTIKRVELADYGSYKCISKNSLGATDGTIKFYRTYTFYLRNKNNKISIALENYVPSKIKIYLSNQTTLDNM